MATSNSTNWTLTRDDIIKAALRIVNAIGTGETVSTALNTETAINLNALVKAYEAHGMPLWKLEEYTFTPTADVSTYSIGIGQTLATTAPLKIIQAWRTLDSGRVPLIIVPRFDYNLNYTTTTSGTPTHLFYTTPDNNGGSEYIGTIKLWRAPDSTFVAEGTISFVGQLPFEDFDAASDNPDFPSYWTQALIWGLADQISMQNGVPPADRAQISARAEKELAQALSFGTEEGSIQFQPRQEWED